MDSEVARAQQIALIPDEPLVLIPDTITVASLDHEDVQPAPRELIESIKKIGLMQPIVVRIHPDSGAFSIVDGRRRLDAARKIGLTSVPCLIAETTLTIADVMTLASNMLRRANKVSEFDAIKRLVDQGANEKDIAGATGMSVGTIRSRQRLLALTPDLVAAFRAGKITATVAEGAAKLPPKIQQVLAAKLLIASKLIEADLHEARTAKQQEAIAALPDALFDLNAPAHDAARHEEPIEAALGREINAIIERLPPLIAQYQHLVRHSLETAATILMDIGLGQVPDDDEILQGEKPPKYVRAVGKWKDGTEIRGTLDTESNTFVSIEQDQPDDGDPHLDDRTPEQEHAEHLREIADVADEPPSDFTTAIECPGRLGVFCGDAWCASVGCAVKQGLSPPPEERT